MGIYENVRRRMKLWLCGLPTVEFRDLVWRPVVADVVVAVAIDGPAGVDLVSGTQAAAWGVSDEDLFAVARANLAVEPVPARHPLSGEVAVYQGESDFVASRVLLLDDLLGEPPDHGAIVAVPNRRTLLVHEIRDLGVIDAFVPMLQATQLLWGQGPDAVSDQLFWWRCGNLERLPVPGAGNGHGGVTPTEFRRLLFRLPPPRSASA